MAQRTIHYLFGEMISRQTQIRDKKRFLLGSILPDAIDTANRNLSHFKIETDTHKYFDFESFRNRYFQQILQDDLYLGYYMHLVEDAFYRDFFYNSSLPMPRVREEVKYLHQDYHILNAYIVQKYQLKNILGTSFPLSNTPILDLTTFFIDPFLAELSHDFIEQTQGQTTFLTEALLDQFIARFLPLAIEEVDSVQKGTSLLKATDFAWPANR